MSAFVEPWNCFEITSDDDVCNDGSRPGEHASGCANEAGWLHALERSEAEVCGVRGCSEHSWIEASALRASCSLEPEHEGQHIAYKMHVVTDRGEDVTWLGPWSDGRPYRTALADRLQEEWERRP